MNPILNRILILGWPFVAVGILVPLLNSLEAPPALAVAVYATIATLGGALLGAFLNIPESWLETEEERDEKRSQQDRQHPARQD